MEKAHLARELRERQYFLGKADRRLIDMLSDDQIINSYLTCSSCGKKQVTEQEQETALQLSTCTQEFFEMCDAFASEHQH